MKWLTGSLSRHGRFFSALACGLLTVLATRLAGFDAPLLAGGDVFYLVFLGLCLVMLAGQKTPDLKARAKTEDEGIVIVVLITLATAAYFCDGVFTALNRTGGFDGLRVAIVGDIKHSRVARSTATVLTMLGADVTLVAPRTLLPPVIDLPFTEALDDVIGDVDVLYLLRMQQERMGEALVPSLREYTMRFGLTADRAARLAPHALVMHPGPMNRGVEITVDPAELPGAVITQQVTNGIAVRMAVLFDLLGGERSSMSEKVTT